MKNADNRPAANYERRWKKYLVHTHEAFLDRVRTTPHDRILDASGGTGLLARMLIERGYPFHDFIVNDPSDQQLNIARDRLAGMPRLDFSSFKAEQLPYEKGRFHRIFCLNSFHFYQDQQKVLDRFFHMLKSGGSLYVLDWNRTGWFKMVNRVIDWYSSEFINTRSLPELEEMFRLTGYNINESESWNWKYWKFLFIQGSKSV